MTSPLFWSTGNSKLRKTRTVSFNLPAFRSQEGFTVCPQAGACAAVCYAQQGRFMMPEAVRVREENLVIVRGDLAMFERYAVADLGRMRQRIVRIHDSGDFFSQAYLDTWFRVAAACPRKRFYCYTKSLHLDWSAMPANMRRTQSAGGKLDHLIDESQSHARIFATHAERKAAGYCDGTRTDRAAIDGRQRIGLVYHGTRKFDAKYLSRLFTT